MENKLVCLQIHNDYQIPGGETKTAKAIADLLQKKGIRVIRYYQTNNDFANADLAGRIKVGLSSLYNRKTVKDIEQILERENVDFALIHNVMPIISNSVYDVLCKHNIPIIKYIQNYNLVCLSGALDCGDKCATCSKHSWIGVKNRCYKNSFLFSCIRYVAKKNLDRLYFDRIAAFMPNSAFVRDRHAQFGIDVAKMRVMYNYISANSNIQDNKEDSYLLYFGRISKEKGVLTVLKAMKELPLQKLVVMGSGELEQEMLLYIKTNNLENVDYIGNKTGEELNTIIRNAKCVIVSSEWDEPLPRTILEAYAQGTPVIGSDRGGIPEMIKEGKTGYIYHSRDIKDLINSIERISLLTPEEYQEMCKNAYAEIECMYTEEKYFERFIKCVKEIVR